MTPSPGSLERPDPLFLSFQLAVAGRYSIDRELGRGGMGVVYLAREVHLDRSVAIKLLPPDRSADPELRARFLREARLAAKLSHPNIIPIHSVEETAGFVFYVMAFIDGETLAHRVRIRGPLSSSDGARVLREVAWALGYAHGQGLVHRDVKPDNILLESASGRVLVADFGIAAALSRGADDSRDAATNVAGTPEFMSPEQVLGKPLDARSDLYGLGATAFFIFSGRFPFEGRTATEILAKQVTEPAPPLASLGLAVPRKLSALVDRCLAKNPEHRPANAMVLAEQLGVSLDQRKELPVALRGFVKRAGRMNGLGTLVGGGALLVGAISVSSVFGSAAGFATMIGGGMLGAFTSFVHSARRLSLLGFGHPDLTPAYVAEREKTREELAIEYHGGPTALERWLPRIALTSLLLTPCFIAAASSPHRLIFGYLLFGAVVSFSTAMLTTLAQLYLMGRHRDVETEFWEKLWVGRIGKAAFSIAGKLIGNRVRGSATTHRATELSLGMAAEQLFQSLPKETRTSLSTLPALLRRLQNDAVLLRKRHEDIQMALSDAGDDASLPEYADIREMRDETHTKLGDAVAALETIRLNLLRLHAGSSTVVGVTATLELAAEISDDVERLIAAQGDIETLMRFPRESTPTPV
jgi:serine/threonine-protein kinase